MADEAERLYALPLEDFIRERDAAAKALRRGGDREAAAQLAKLPKPTPAAWAANQVAREHPEVLEAFLDAGAALREAQEAALAGRGGELRDATRAQRRAVDAFMAAAQPLRPSGRPLSRTMGDRLRTTLLAAAGNDELSSALAEGRLALEAEAGGAWPPPDAADVAAAPARAAKTVGGSGARRRRAKTADRAGDEGVETARDAEAAADRAGDEGVETARDAEAAAERERAAEAKRRREALERGLREARGALKVRERALTAAEKDATRAAQRLDHALAEAEDARVEAEAMEKVLGEARAALDATRDEVARLEERLD